MKTGTVYLVGAGPGDPGLLTLRGRELLEQSDIVLYDGLVNPLLLQFAGGVCERTARTRTDSHRIVPQQEINDRLIAEAKAGKTVVRLKGGDPYIFGRGSEEAAALQAAGIVYEVVPGITAATAAGVYAGFSFTHRNISSAVAFVTGHEDPTRETSHLDYSALAAFPGTLVFYMGLGRIQTICNELIANGKPASTPAAVICKASLPEQKVVTSTLEDLPQRVTEHNLVPPSLIVVGECTRLRETSSWFEQRPLMGLKIGITRPEQQCSSVAQQIAEQSGQAVIMPLIQISPVDDQQASVISKTLEGLHTFDWLVFTSGNGVEAFFDHLQRTGKDARSLSNAKIAAIGPSVVAALKTKSINADLVPRTYDSESLAEELGRLASDQNILWVKASRSRDVLPQALNNAGNQTTELVAYNNENVTTFPADIVQQLKDNAIHWIGLSSPSIARQFARLLQTHDIDAHKSRTKLVAISPITAAAAVESGLAIAAEATIHTWDGMLEAIACAESS